MAKLLSFILLCTLSWGVQSFPAELLVAHPLRQGELPLMKPRIIKSKFKSLDDAYARIYFSYDFKTSYPETVTTGADLDKEEIAVFSDVIHRRGNFAGLKEKNHDLAFLFERFEIGDPRTTDMLIDSAEQNIGLTLVMTDFNTSMETEFNRGLQMSANFKNSAVTIKPSREGVELKRLLKAGFIICDEAELFTKISKGKRPLKLIVSQPLYKPGQENPIQHEKQAVIAVIDDNLKFVKGIISTSSSHNHSIPPNVTFDSQGRAQPFYRNNMLEIIQEPNVAQHTYDHLMALANAIGDGKEIKDIKSIRPIQIEFQNGETLAIYHTDGKYNPNRAGVELLLNGANFPEKFKIDEVLYSEFVFTLRDEFEALRQLMKVQTSMGVTAILDGQFLDAFGYSLAAPLVGIPEVTPFGGIIYPLGHDSQMRVNAFGYQHLLEGRHVHKLEGAPLEIVLNHLKLRIVKAKVMNKQRTYIQKGSFNLSGHFASAERQDQIEAGEFSKVALATEESVRAFILGESKKNSAVPLRLAVVITGLARLMGRSVFEIPQDKAEEIVRVLQDFNRDATTPRKVEKLLLDLGDLPTFIKDAPSKTEIAARLKIIIGFLNWYKSPTGPNGLLYVDQIISFGLPLAYPDATPASLRSIVENLVSHGQVKTMEPSKLELLVKKAWAELKIKSELPPPHESPPVPPPKCGPEVQKIAS